MARIGKVFHLSGSCAINRKFSVLILCICFAYLLVCCTGVENVQLTPTIQEISSEEIQINPSFTELSDNDQTRDQDDMRMVFIPQEVFHMGSTESAIAGFTKERARFTPYPSTIIGSIKLRSATHNIGCALKREFVRSQ
jgi:hypothetical protein